MVAKCTNIYNLLWLKILFHLFLKKVKRFREEYVSKFKELKLDAIITPGVASPAFKHGMVGDILISILYNIVPNLINMPTGNLFLLFLFNSYIIDYKGIVPVTLIKNNEDSAY